MEYLAVFAITALMIIPMILIFTTQSSHLKAEIINAQLDKASSEITDSAEEVHYMGPPTQKTIKVTFPEGIKSIQTLNKLLVFNVQTESVEYQFNRETIANITGNLKTYEGIHILTIKAEEGYVNITDK